MPALTAKRTLVKSPPELWEELSEVERLAKHLGAFGEITITKLEPEHTVAWEGEHASGTVSIEPSGWGTKVTLRAELPEREGEEPEPEPVAASAPEPEIEPEPVGVAEEPEAVTPEPEPVAAEPEPEPLIEEPAPEPVAEEPAEEEPVALEAVADEPAADTADTADDPTLDPERARVILDEALDTLGAAHHRPFSRG